MRRFILLTLTIFFLLSYTFSIAKAQDLIIPKKPSETGQSSQIEVDLITDTQSAWNRSIPVRVRFKSFVSGKKIEVKWHFPSGLTATKKIEVVHDFNADQYYVLENIFTPKGVGKQRIDVDILVHGYDSFYLNTTSLVVELDNELLITPKTSAYEQKVLLRYGTLALLVVGALIITFFAIKYFVTKLIPMWLEHEVNTPH